MSGDELRDDAEGEARAETTDAHPPGTRPEPAEPLGELRFRHLLVAIDGSSNAELALSAAVIAARRDHASLTLIGVAPEATHWATAATYDPTLQGRIDGDIERALQDAVARIPREIPVTTLFRRGKPGPRIVAEAAAGNYDAILVGARGVGRIGALIGSVSHHVLRHAHVKVFVAHAPPGCDEPDAADPVVADADA